MNLIQASEWSQLGKTLPGPFANLNLSPVIGDHMSEYIYELVVYH
jgi:hypothetical protein